MSQICGKCETNLHGELDCKACGQRHLRCGNCGDAVMSFLSFCPTCSRLMEEQPAPEPEKLQAKTVKIPLDQLPDASSTKDDEDELVRAAQDLILVRSDKDLEKTPPVEAQTIPNQVALGAQTVAMQTASTQVTEQPPQELKERETKQEPSPPKPPQEQPELAKTVIVERPDFSRPQEDGIHRQQAYFDPRDYISIFEKCQQLIKEGYKLYGLFGRPESGKTLFLYSLGRMLQGGQNETVSGYELDSAWKSLIIQQKEALRLGRPAATERGLHIYHAHLQNSKTGNSHLAFLDISGEQFEQIQSWQEEVGAFFINYLAHCSGYLVFLDIDEDIIDPIDTVLDRYKGKLSERRIEEIVDLKKGQMENIKDFLAVAAAIPKVKKLKHLEAMRKLRGAQARTNKLGRAVIKAPVCLAISKADRFRKMKFDGFAKIIPGGDGPYGDPWNLIQKLWPGHLQTILSNAPQLKISWLSSLGADWQPGERPGEPVGLDPIFQHLISNPPPKWGMSTQRYRKLRTLFGI